MTARPAESGPTAEQFRAVMAHVPAAVAVVTTRAGGTPHGTTVSAFMSLSMDPPMLLVSLANTSTLLAKLHPGSVAGVNVLTSGQADIAAHFARKDDEHVRVEWGPPDGDAPRLPGAHAWITCTVTELITVGDHTLVIGAVNTARATPDAPLIYSRRTYGTHTAA